MSESVPVVFVDDYEVARVTGVSRSWFQQRRSRADGGPPFYKIGGRVVYRLDEVVAWVAAQRVAP